jgi:F0F1-type ATP synthase delta subunit
MSAGVKIKAGDKLVDATLETMLENAIEDIISKK